MNDGGGGRLGSAARNTSSTIKRKSIKIGYFGPEQYVINPPLYYCDLDLSRPCWVQTC